MSAVGPIGRLGRFTATHVRAVVLSWVAIAVVFGFFAPAGGDGALGRRLAGQRLPVGARAKPSSRSTSPARAPAALMVVVHSPR